MTRVVRRLNPQCGKVPPGGVWRVKYEDHVFEGDTFDELVERVDAYRRINQISLSSSRDDLEAYFCDKHPYLSHLVAEEVAPGESGEKDKGIAETMMEWLRERGRKPFVMDFVPFAMRRVEACAKCPMNVNPVLSDEDAAFVEAQALRLTRGRCAEVGKYGNQLHFCKVHGWHNGVAVWESKHKNTPSQRRPDQPSGCWVL